MHLLVVGISHHTAPVTLREKLAFNAPRALDALRNLQERFTHAELALLSTCNRTEIYTARPLHDPPQKDDLVEYFAEQAGRSVDEISPHLVYQTNQRAIAHLFDVACGLESMVLGEYQVVAQVKAAYQQAQEAGTCGSALHQLFQNALAVSKRVRSETAICAGRMSVSSIAVEFAGHLFSHFADKTVLTIGAGKMTELTLRHFMQLQPGRLLVTNRSADTAQQLAEQFGGTAVPFDRLTDHLVEADVVISSTGSSEPIVRVEHFDAIDRRRRYRPLFIIDIAVPRDFDEAIAQVEHVYLYNLDDLQKVIEANHEQRAAEIDACRAIIDPAVDICYRQIQRGDLSRIIERLRHHLHDLAYSEAERVSRRLQHTDPDQHDQLLAEHMRRLVNRILHRPLDRLGRDDSAQAAMLATALRRLFDLDDEAPANERDRGAEDFADSPPSPQPPRSTESMPSSSTRRGNPSRSTS
jgi:glutamyl-tRNA reductase